MDQKYQKLINYLNSQSEPKKSKEIANALNISIRSVGNYINEINNIYKRTIIISSHQGYEINRNLANQLSELNNDIPQDFEGRAYFIIKSMLLEHSLTLDLFELCDQLFVSYSTIKNIIKKMNNKFSVFNVKFICKRDLLYIEGNESDKRKLISFVINESSCNSYLDLLQLQKSFPKYDISNFQALIYSTFKEHNFYLNDFTAINYIMHLLIIIDRNTTGEYLNNHISYFGNINDDIKDLANSITEKLEKKYAATFNEYEATEILILTNIVATSSLPITKIELKKVVDKEIIELNGYYIDKINNIYLINLNNDIFFTPFCLHIKNLIFRAKNNHFISNPFTDSIKQNNPIIFDIATFIALDLSERYKINIKEDEIAFLAIHIGAEVERQQKNASKLKSVLICSSYCGLDLKVYNQLLINFGTYISIDKNLTNEIELDDNNYDIIFTTYPLKKNYNALIIQISPFNISNQRQMIEDNIIKKQRLINNQKLKWSVQKYFEKDLFTINTIDTNKENILSHLCNTLVKKEYVNDDFYDSVCQRERAASTAFSNIAIPHSMKMNANKTCISVVVSEKGIRWDNTNVNFILLIAISKAEKEIFRILYEELIKIFSETEFPNDVLRCKSFSEFEQTLLSYFDLT